MQFFKHIAKSFVNYFGPTHLSTSNGLHQKMPVLQKELLKFAHMQELIDVSDCHTNFLMAYCDHYSRKDVLLVTMKAL